MSAPDPLIRSRDIKRYAAEFSAMTLHRHILAGRFPSPATTINGLRYWRRSDLIAWRDGRRSGWPPDPEHRCASANAWRLCVPARHTEFRWARNLDGRRKQPEQPKGVSP